MREAGGRDVVEVGEAGLGHSYTVLGTVSILSNANVGGCCKQYTILDHRLAG